MTDTIFFRLLANDGKAAVLSDAIEELREEGGVPDVYQADPTSFRQISGSPFAYWVSEEVRSKFAKLPPFEAEDRTVKQGLATADDFRFVRTWWEIALADVLDGGGGPYEDIRTFQEWCSGRTVQGKGWVPFAKGGEYSPYYADISLVVNWKNDGEEIKTFTKPDGRLASRPQNTDYYFRPGLTFPRRTRRFCPKVLPAGVIFGHGGQTAFSFNDIDVLLGVLGSSTCQFLVTLFLGTSPQDQGGTNPQFETGMIQKIPVARLTSFEKSQLRNLTNWSVNLKRSLDRANENSHAFYLPALLQMKRRLLADSLSSWQQGIAEKETEMLNTQREIDDIAYRLYDISSEDRQAIVTSVKIDNAVMAGLLENSEIEGGGEGLVSIRDHQMLIADLLSYAIGSIFGRWDVRIALDPSLNPKLQDPFAPLPVCSPGTLVGLDGLPASKDGIASEEWMRARPDAITLPPEGSVQSPTILDSGYPLSVDWDGILVDDSGHPDDILRRVRDVLELLWGERADAIEQEACEILGVEDLRIYFRNPGQFFDYHVKRYSVSRRKAPIYWLLQSPKRHYSLWLYYHRLDSDTLFKALKRYVEPKIRMEENRLGEYEAQRRSAGMGGREAKRAEKAVEDQEALLADLREFRDRLERAAKLYLHPDLNDGVVLNIASLWELVPWKEAKSKWNELLAGKYEWSSIGKQLREKGLV